MAELEDTKAPAMRPRIDDDDVEGHRMVPRIDADEEDVEGHRMVPRIDADEEDVEGHFGYLKSPTSRGE
jgi:hypothetical protein